MKVFVINPGSTTTKIALFDGRSEVFSETIRHSPEELGHFDSILGQKEFRKGKIIDELEKRGVDLKSFDAIIGRGGIVKPIPAGTYVVNDILLKDLADYSFDQQHAANLGGIIAYEMAAPSGKPAFIADPICVDEFEDISRISGLREIQRKSLLHALNMRASMYRYAENSGKNVEDLNLIIVHLGGGISVSPVKEGRLIDVNNADEGGPFSPQRPGGLPSIDVVNLAYSGKYTRNDLVKMFTKTGGLLSYLGTDDMKEVIKRINEGDKEAKEVFDAMCYQISKEIGAMATVLKGKIDAIIITGGVAYNEEVVQEIERRVDFIAKIFVYPGEFEMESLAFAALRVLNGEEKPREYT